MNDLRSPLEDRPYRPAAQDNLSHDYEMSLFDRIRYSRWFPLGSVFAAVLIFSGIVSYAYKQGAQTGVNATTPVVAADTAAYKEKPENPGGMDVPFQDAVVFDQLQNQDQNKPEGDTIESLLPPPEQPVSATTPAAPPVAAEAKPAETDSTKPAAADKPVADKPAAETLTETTKTVAPATAAATPAASASVAETIVKEAPQAKPLATETDPEAAPIASSSAEPKNLEAPVAAPKTEVKTEAKAETKTTAKIEEKPMDKIIEKTIDKPVEKPVAKAPVIASAPKPIASPAPVAASAPAIASGSYRIQLGAFRDESAARAAWQHVQSQFSQLSGVTPAFPRADLGAKGIFYRAQGTNLSKESADSLCRTINAAKAGSCIVTH